MCVQDKHKPNSNNTHELKKEERGAERGEEQEREQAGKQKQTKSVSATCVCLCLRVCVCLCGRFRLKKRSEKCSVQCLLSCSVAQCQPVFAFAFAVTVVCGHREGLPIIDSPGNQREQQQQRQ